MKNQPSKGIPLLRKTSVKGSVTVAQSMIDNFAKLAPAIAAILIPLAVAYVGYIAQDLVNRRSTNQEYIKQSIEIINNRRSEKSLRHWAVGILNDYSPRPLEKDLESRLLAGETLKNREYSSENRGVSTISPDGKLVASISHYDLRIWETSHGRLVGGGEWGAEATVISFSPNNEWLVAGGAEAEVRIWNLATRTNRSLLIADGKENGDLMVLGITVASDSKSFILFCSNGYVIRYNLPTGEEMSRDYVNLLEGSEQPGLGSY